MRNIKINASFPLFLNYDGTDSNSFSNLLTFIRIHWYTVPPTFQFIVWEDGFYYIVFFSSNGHIRYDTTFYAWDIDRQFTIFHFFVYLGAACLPLNVVENQTTVGRLCRLAIGNATGHSKRTSVNSATIGSRHSRTITAATNNNFFFVNRDSCERFVNFRPS